MSRIGIGRKAARADRTTAASPCRRAGHSAQRPGGGGVRRLTTISPTAMPAARSADTPSRLSSRDSASGSITHENADRAGSHSSAAAPFASSSISAISASAVSGR